MINFTSLNGLGNRLNWTRFDGVDQPYPSSYVDGYPEYTYNMAQAMRNPYSSLYSNPLMLGTNLTGVNPLQNLLAQAGVDGAGQRGLCDGLKIRLAGYASSLSGLESQIQSMMSYDKLTDAQKSRLQTLLNRINTLKQQITDLNNKQNLTVQDAEAVQKSIADLTKDAQEAGQKIVKEVQDAEAKANGEDGTGSSDGTDSTDGASSKEKTEKEKAQEKAAMAEICNEIDTDIRGAGTKYDELKALLTEKINKDNVLDLFDTWNSSYKGKEPYDGGDDGQYGLIGSLMNDCEDDEKEEIATILINALRDKALDLGIDVSSEVSTAYAAIKSSGIFGLGIIPWRDDDKICSAVNALYQKVKTESDKVEAKQKSDAANEKKKADNEKAKAEEKAKQEAVKKETDAKNQFKADLREIIGDDEAEISDKVEYKDDHFKVRVEGRDYYGSDYRELAEALKAAGYSPEKYLKKSTVKKAA